MRMVAIDGYVVYWSYLCFVLSLIFFMVILRKTTLLRKYSAPMVLRKRLAVEEILKISPPGPGVIIKWLPVRMSDGIKSDLYGFASKNSGFFILIRTPVCVLRWENRIVLVSLVSTSSSYQVFLRGTKLYSFAMISGMFMNPDIIQGPIVGPQKT